MTLAQNYDAPSGHQQSLYEIETFNVSSLERCRADTDYELFLPVTFNLPK